MALIQLHSKVRLRVGVGAELERRLEHQPIKLNNYVATHNWDMKNHNKRAEADMGHDARYVQIAGGLITGASNKQLESDGESEPEAKTGIPLAPPAPPAAVARPEDARGLASSPAAAAVATVPPPSPCCVELPPSPPRSLQKDGHGNCVSKRTIF